MGLGKTLMTISLIATHQKESSSGLNTLIVVPLTLLSQWQNEIEKHTEPHALSVIEFYGSERSSIELEDYDIVLTTYSTL